MVPAHKGDCCICTNVPDLLKCKDIDRRSVLINGQHGEQTWPVPKAPHRAGAVQRRHQEAGPGLIPTVAHVEVSADPGSFGCPMRGESCEGSFPLKCFGRCLQGQKGLVAPAF